jgi:hypothetical protein
MTGLRGARTRCVGPWRLPTGAGGSALTDQNVAHPLTSDWLGAQDSTRRVTKADVSWWT